MPHSSPEWTGHYYDGRTAERHEVTVTIGAAGLDIRCADGSTRHCPFDALRQTQGAVAGERLRIEWGTDPVESLLLDQPGLPEAVRALAPAAIPVLRPARRTASIVVWSLAAIIGGTLLYVVGSPIMADALAPRVPPAWERTLGEGVVDEIAPSHRRCTAPTALADLRAIVDRLAAAAPPTANRFEILVIRDSSINAFATPGGFVVVNGGLIAAASTPEQLAGVLAHEMQHVIRRHSTRAIIREAPLRLALASISGGGLETAATVAGTLGALRYRRADEAEADREGVRLLAAAGIDPQGLVAFMRVLDEEGKDGPRFVRYLSSHPHTAERVAALERMAADAGAVTGAPVFAPEAWQRIRGMCAAAAAR